MALYPCEYYSFQGKGNSLLFVLAQGQAATPFWKKSPPFAEAQGSIFPKNLAPYLQGIFSLP